MNFSKSNPELTPLPPAVTVAPPGSFRTEKRRTRKEIIKIITILVFVAVVSASIYYFHLVVKTEIIFTHLFYIPITLAAIWWGRKVFWVVLLLVVQLLGVHFFTDLNFPNIVNDGIRSVMFLVIAFLISALSERNKQHKNLLERAGAEAEKKVRERTAELSEANAQLSAEVAKRKINEAEARAVATRLSYLTKYANDFIILLDENFKFIETNERVADVYGYRREELFGMYAPQLRAPEARDLFLEQIRALGDTGKTLFETVHQTKGGRKFPVEISIRAFTIDGQGRYQAIIRDITERKKAEESLREATEKERKLIQKMEAFVANASHEIRGPLGIIRESLDIVGSETVGKINAEQKECLAAGKRTVDRLIRLLGDLLKLARAEAGNLTLQEETFAVASFLEEIVIPYLSQISKQQLVFKMEIEPGVGEIRADPGKLGEVVVNLLTNAIKYTPPGESVTVRVKGTPAELRVEVEDTGPGIPAEFLEKVFDKFVRINSERQDGTGLGLSIAKELIELQKGRIWAESDGGRGSRFIFTLPRNIKKAL
ncbi:MAG TPA: HAMP domain-containing sensor histidine kinase [Candidatus Omnitrophota bacterium]|nr:HAMP domain-containing sensor histidine kinase [Candidatus Omnitrophota bacterium]HPS36326.1 HAMP domain-containing sensor histidine kinase [Candidatus Omnitrophota bacterium]